MIAYLRADVRSVGAGDKLFKKSIKLSSFNISIAWKLKLSIGHLQKI